MRAGLEHGIGQGFPQPVEILAYPFGKLERFRNDAQNLLLGGAGDAVRVQEVLFQAGRLFLQLDHAEGADRLHEIGRHGH